MPKYQKLFGDNPEVVRVNQEAVNFDTNGLADVSDEVAEVLSGLPEHYAIVGAPVEQEQAPVAPVEQEQAPVEQEQAPVEQEQAPVEQEQAPVAPAPAPAPAPAQVKPTPQAKVTPPAPPKK